MVNYQIEPNINQMNLLNLIVKLGSLKYFQGIAIDVENTVRFNLGMATLN